MSVHINLLAVLFAGIGCMIVGLVWYSRFLFGRKWMALKGFDSKDIQKQQKSMAPLYSVSFFISLIQGIILSGLLYATEVASIEEAWLVAFFLWIGFIFITQINSAIFDSKKFSLTLLLIDGGYQLMSILVMASILSVWL